MARRHVVVIDDDYWNRTAMSAALAAHELISVVASGSQDDAIGWPLERWEGVDLAIVDVFDESAPAETGADVYSGITALHRLRRSGVDALAITPHVQHPLVQLRVYESGANWLYRRWELNDPSSLYAAVLNPDDDHRPVPPDPATLREFGAARAHPQQAVDQYESSVLNGHLRASVGLKSLPIGRRQMFRFRSAIQHTGFQGTESAGPSSATRAPRWPDVRDYLLILLGRRAVPPTEVDRDDSGPVHAS